MADIKEAANRKWKQKRKQQQDELQAKIRQGNRKRYDKLTYDTDEQRAERELRSKLYREQQEEISRMTPEQKRARDRADLLEEHADYRHAIAEGMGGEHGLVHERVMEELQGYYDLFYAEYLEEQLADELAEFDASTDNEDDES